MTVKKHLIENESKGQWLEAAPGEHFLIRVPGSETNNSYSVTEFLSDPGSSTSIHLHEREDEYLLVVKEWCECCMEKGRSTPRQVL
jgi:mannose-6-phosphate isomerase-like protein (cupin superfamily)